MKLLLPLIFLSLISIGISCRCAVKPVEEYFCKSDFAVKVKVESEKKILPGIYSYYEIQVLQIYKENNKTREALSSGRLKTAIDTGGCGRFLEKDKIYVINGFINQDTKEAITSSCTFGKAVEELDANEKLFYEKGYNTLECPPSESNSF